MGLPTFGRADFDILEQHKGQGAAKKVLLKHLNYWRRGSVTKAERINHNETKHSIGLLIRGEQN
jgi:hypothetical protein